MDRHYIKDRLVMKPLEMKHLTQYNELLKYVFQVTNRQMKETGWENIEIERAKKPMLKLADGIGWFDGSKLVSQLIVYPFRVNIHGRLYDMGGLTGVGTYPEYANMGLMHDLMTESLKHMRQKGQYISYLFPYSIPFYRRKGWEIISDVINFSIRDTQLPPRANTPGTVRRTDTEHPDINRIYLKYAYENHAALIRNNLAWEEYWRWEPDSMIAAVYYDEKDDPQGFIFYHIANEIFHIKEMIFNTQEARIGLWNFISAHFSMITNVEGNTYKDESIAFLLDDSEIDERIKPYFMARIIDVKEFLARFPFTGPGESFHFIVEDSMAEWNNGIFSLEWDGDGNLSLSDKRVGHAVALGIGTLTTMLMSYRRPAYLLKIGHIAAAEGAAMNLERIIPRGVPYVSDYF